MTSFLIQDMKRDKLCRILIMDGFRMFHWEEMDREFRAKLAEGNLNWDLDVRQLAFVNSMLLGLFVEMNGLITLAGGSMRLVVLRNSQLTQLLQLSRLNRLIKVFEL